MARWPIYLKGVGVPPQLGRLMHPREKKLYSANLMPHKKASASGPMGWHVGAVSRTSILTQFQVESARRVPELLTPTRVAPKRSAQEDPTAKAPRCPLSSKRSLRGLEGERAASNPASARLGDGLAWPLPLRVRPPHQHVPPARHP